MSANLGSVLQESCNHGGDDETILVDLLTNSEPREYSFAELNQLADLAARRVRENTTEYGSRVGILGPNSAYFLATLLGIMQAGRIAVPINTKFPAKTFEFICQDADLSLIFVDDDHRFAIPPDISTIKLDAEIFSGSAADQNYPVFEPADETPALVLYTSGSTGHPKGVVLSHASQWSIIHRFGEAVENLTGIVAAPLFHMNAILFSLVLLSQRSTVVLMPDFDAAEYLCAIERYQVNLITGVPTMLSLLAQKTELVSRLDLSSVVSVHVGSAPLTQTVAKQSRKMFPDAQITNSYGSTEAGSGMFGPHRDGIPVPALSLGCAGDHVEVRLNGSADEDVGELEVKTPSAMNGYLNLPDKTAEVMLDAGWIKTGDIMRRDDLGFFYFVGRVDDMFVCGGENIYPGQIERILEKSPEIAQVCVVPIVDKIKGQIPVAYVVLPHNVQLDVQQVKKIALAGMPPYMHPRHVSFLDSMPLSSTNKVDRKALENKARKSFHR